MEPRARKALIAATVCLVGLVLAFVYFSPLTDGPDHRQRATTASLKGIGLTLLDYQAKHGQLPSTEQGLRVIFPGQGSAVIDAWGRDFV